MTTLQRPLILASASPRRAELLRQIGVPFHLLVGHAEERLPCTGEDILAWATELAEEKARAAARAYQGDEPALILAADTAVLLPHTDAKLIAPLWHQYPVSMLGKPADADEASAMLTILSGREHVVISAFALLGWPDGLVTRHVSETRVTFRTLDAQDIREYLASGEAWDKAGAYAIQGRGATLIAEIHGEYSTVVGLPLAALWQALHPWRR